MTEPGVEGGHDLAAATTEWRRAQGPGGLGMETATLERGVLPRDAEDAEEASGGPTGS